MVHGFDKFRPELTVGGAEALRCAQGFARSEVSEHFLTLYGNPGVGKSHLLKAVAREMLGAGFPVKYVNTPQFLDELRNTFNKANDNTFEGVFRGYQTPHLLVMDDMGSGYWTEWGQAQMELLVDYRHRNEMLTAFASNLDREELAMKWGQRIADRVFDFGSGAALIAAMGGASYRSRKEY